MPDFIMPSLGSDMEAGTLVEWLVEPGQAVKRGDIVAVVETQKGAIDIEIFEDGTISEILVPVGEKVPVGTVLARLAGGADEAATAPSPPESAAPIEAPPAPTSDASPSPSIYRGAANDEIKVSPRARRIARQAGLDLSTIVGSGPGGSITGEDVESAAKSPAKSPAPSPGGSDSNMRRAIAAAMTRANTEIPHYYLGQTIELGAMIDWLATHNADKPIEARVLPVTPILKAVALALRKVPELNGHYGEDGFSPAQDVNLGMAVSLRGGGLVAPAIPHADSLGLPEMMARLQELVGRARSGDLRSSDMSGATVTITSLGDRGVEDVFGVISPPQVALVGIGAILERPWVVEGKLAVRPTVRMSLAADHRVSDGHRGGRFLQAVDKLLQKPEKLA